MLSEEQQPISGSFIDEPTSKNINSHTNTDAANAEDDSEALFAVKSNEFTYHETSDLSIELTAKPTGGMTKANSDVDVTFESLFDEAKDTSGSLDAAVDFDDLFAINAASSASDELLESQPLAKEDTDLSAFWEESDLNLSQTQSVTDETLFAELLDEFSSADDEHDVLQTLASTVDAHVEIENTKVNNSVADVDLGESLSLENETTAKANAFAQLDDLLAANQPTSDATEEFAELDDLLGETSAEVVASTPTDSAAEFAELDDLLAANQPTSDATEEFAELDDLLGETSAEVVASTAADSAAEFAELDDLLAANQPTSDATEEFAELDDLLGETSAEVVISTATDSAEEFAELDDLLAETSAKVESKAKHEPTQTSEALTPTQPVAAVAPRRAAFEQTMRVAVKQLDNMGNLVGELVVNRNSLEQDQQRLRQFTENLLHRVQQLNDLGSRMQELYERSLLEASLISSRQAQTVTASVTTASDHATGMNFDALEMDRFTGFHTLSQEMIEMIVRVRESASDIEFVTDETEQVARQFRQVTTDLQAGLTRSRMIPFAQIAERLPRAVKEITLKYGKQAELHIEGRDTLIDKVILEQLYDPMTHLVNNSITHGIETPAERLAKGKSPIGQIKIQAFYQGNQTVITVSDDGAGIDPDRVLTKAVQKGLITIADAKTMSRADVYNLLFHPGFSTKDQVDQFAGRGVGMDVVKTSLNEIRGTITTDSTVGKGTTFTIRLPLTLSICKALCCISDKNRIAFPMDGVEDTLDIPASAIVTSAQERCISWRDSLLPLKSLKDLLNYNHQIGRGNVYGSKREDDLISVVVVRSAGTYIALQVDQVLGEQEIVIKQFDAPVPKPVGVAGATVMGDGRIMPIADVLELIDLSLGRLQPQISEWAATPVLPEMPDVKTEPMVLIIDDSITVRELLSMTFNKAGYRVEQARDGQEAWDKLRDGLPCDLVFCDIEMPRMDGLELLSRIQKDPNLSRLPIAMLTSRGADRHRQMAVQLGASGYFTKPYIEEALLDGASRMLKGEVLVSSS